MRKVSPYLKIVLTFLIVILIGTFLLMLPISMVEGHLNFVDALFMSTSAVCVTGLSVIPNISLEVSLFGKIVLGFLIEIGGLSFITIATFFIVILGGKIGINDRFLLKESLNQDSLRGIVALVKKIILTSFIIQLCGIVLNCFALMPYYDGFWTILGVSMFHTIASFNNSGLDIFGDSSMVNFAGDWFLNINTMLLIILGGLGFYVIDDILTKRRFKRLNINSKIVLITTGLLIVGGTLFLKLANNGLTWLQAMFMSVTSRTAGFATVDCSNLNSAEFAIINFLMFIGASPGSTGGGIKTATFFVLMITIFAYAVGKRPIVFKREIEKNTIVKAFALTVTAIMFCGLSIFLIALFDPELAPKEIIFEVISAFSTTGLSMGATQKLSIPSELVISFMMFFGRLGPLTVLNLINRNWKTGKDDSIRYVEEKVVIG